MRVSKIETIQSDSERPSTFLEFLELKVFEIEIVFIKIVPKLDLN